MNNLNSKKSVCQPQRVCLLVSLFVGIQCFFISPKALAGPAELELQPRQTFLGGTIRAYCNTLNLERGKTLSVSWRIYENSQLTYQGSCTNTQPGLPAMACDPPLQVQEPYHDDATHYARTWRDYTTRNANTTIQCELDNGQVIEGRPRLEQRTEFINVHTRCVSENNRTLFWRTSGTPAKYFEVNLGYEKNLYGYEYQGWQKIQDTQVSIPPDGGRAERLPSIKAFNEQGNIIGFWAVSTPEEQEPHNYVNKNVMLIDEPNPCGVLRFRVENRSILDLKFLASCSGHDIHSFFQSNDSGFVTVDPEDSYNFERLVPERNIGLHTTTCQLTVLTKCRNYSAQKWFYFHVMPAHCSFRSVENLSFSSLNTNTSSLTLGWQQWLFSYDYQYDGFNNDCGHYIVALHKNNAPEPERIYSEINNHIDVLKTDLGRAYFFLFQQSSVIPVERGNDYRITITPDYDRGNITDSCENHQATLTISIPAPPEVWLQVRDVVIIDPGGAYSAYQLRLYLNGTDTAVHSADFFSNSSLPLEQPILLSNLTEDVVYKAQIHFNGTEDTPGREDTLVFSITPETRPVPPTSSHLVYPETSYRIYPQTSSKFPEETDFPELLSTTEIRPQPTGTALVMTPVPPSSISTDFPVIDSETEQESDRGFRYNQLAPYSGYFVFGATMTASAMLLVPLVYLCYKKHERNLDIQEISSRGQVNE